jgi:DNA-binding PadR family transcriptional regulator
MPLHHAVLGLLAEQPSYGYQLKASFERAIGPQWGELNIGHLYQILDRLVRDELVTRERVAQRDRPDKAVYALTAAGRRELDRWVAEPVARPGGYRDEFFLKLLVASRLGPDRLRQVTRTQRAAYLLELRSLTELQLQHRHQPLVALLVEAALLHTRANLAVVERAADDADRIAGAAARLLPDGPAEPSTQDPPPATARTGDATRRRGPDDGSDVGPRRAQA